MAESFRNWNTVYLICIVLLLYIVIVIFIVLTEKQLCCSNKFTQRNLFLVLCTASSDVTWESRRLKPPHNSSVCSTACLPEQHVCFASLNWPFVCECVCVCGLGCRPSIGDRWISLTKGYWCGKHFHVMTWSRGTNFHTYLVLKQ